MSRARRTTLRKPQRSRSLRVESLETRTLLSVQPVFAPLEFSALARGSTEFIAAPRKAGMTTGFFASAKPVKAPADDFGNTFSTASAIALDSAGAATKSGKINFVADLDMFSVVANLTGTMTVQLNKANKKVTLDPELTIFDAAQAQLAYNNNAISGTTTDALVSFDVVAGTKYYVQASGYNSTIGAYSLKISTKAAPAPTPEPTPDPTPTPTPTTLPGYLPGAGAYTAAASVSGEILVTADGNVLVVRGTDGADQITISATTDALLVGSQSFVGSFVGIAVYGFGMADTIRQTSSLWENLTTVIYGGLGDDTVYEAGADRAFLFGEDGNDLLVSVGGNADMLQGGAGLDSFWFDSTDTLVDAEAAETAAKTIHKITAFAQPTSDPAKAVSLEIAGQDIVDPVAAYPYTNNFINRPLWADGPQFNDIKQGQVGDCYYLAGLSAMALTDPGLIQQSITALGDGTYAVRFYRNGVETYYRIDAQLATYGSSPWYAGLTRSGGELWVALLEKAFAQFRYNQNSYSSIEGGWMHEAYTAISGATYRGISPGSTGADSLAQTMANELSAGHAVTAGSYSSATSPIIGGHAYTVQNVALENGVWYVTVYNPWGFDGVSYDSNSGDGLLKLTAATFQAKFSAVEVCLA